MRTTTFDVRRFGVVLVLVGLLGGASPAPAAAAPAAGDEGAIVSETGGSFEARGTVSQQVTCTSTSFDVTLQCAIDGLAAGRTGQRVVSVVGDFEMSTTISLPSHTTLDLEQASITRADAMNSIMFQNADLEDGNSDIIIRGGHIDGNKDGQTVNPPYPALRGSW